MATILNPYLNFRDTTAEVMAFYHEIFGGELKMSTFADFQVSADPDEMNKIMHSMLTTPGGLVLMAADVPNSMELTVGNNYYVSLSGEDSTELTSYWEALSVSGSVQQPLMTAPWGDAFGSCTDKYGTGWLVNILGVPA